MGALVDAPPVPFLRRPFFRNTGPNVYSSAGAVTSFFVPTAPFNTASNIVAGDWIFIYLFGTNVSSGIACPGFQVIQDNGPFAAFLWKQATDADVTALGYTITGINSVAVAATICAVSAPGGLDPVVFGPLTTSSTSTSLVVPGITLAGASDLVLLFIGNENGFTNVGEGIVLPNSNWTAQAYNGTPATNPSVMCATNPYFGAGATGTVTCTTVGGVNTSFWSGLLVGFAAATSPARLDLRTEFNLGSLGWVDVSEDVQITTGTDTTVGRGKPDEQTTMTPSTLGLTLNNADARYSDINPAGPFYGNLGRNTPIRVSVPEGAGYVRFRDIGPLPVLANDTRQALWVSGPVTNPGTDIDVQMDVTLDNWRTAAMMAGKWGSSGQFGWLLLLNDFGSLTLNVSTVGTDVHQLFSQVPIPIPPGRRGCIRFTYSAFQGQADLWFSPVPGLLAAQWQHLDGAVLGTGGVFGSNQPVVFGNPNNFTLAASFTGKLHAAQEYGGTLPTRGTKSSTLSAANGGTITWSTNPRAASKVLVFVFTNPGETITSVVDNGTTPTTFTQDAVESANGNLIALYRGDNITLPASGSYTVTVTGTGGFFIVASGQAYFNVKAGAPTQVAVGTSAASSTPGTAGVTSAAPWGTAFTGFASFQTAEPVTPVAMQTPYFATQYSATSQFATAWADSLAYGTTAIPAPGWYLGGVTPQWAALTAVYDAATAPVQEWSPDFTVQPPGIALVNDNQGNQWQTHNLAVISDRHYTFWGELSAFPTSWNTKGTSVKVAMQGGGLLRRLSQSASQQPLQSALRRAWGPPGNYLTNLKAYWPCEDGNSQGFSFSTSTPPTGFAPGIKGVPVGTYTGQPQFASNSGFQCSLSLPSFNQSTWTFQVPGSGTDSANILRFLLQIPAAGEPAAPFTSTAIIARMNTLGTIARLEFYYQSQPTGSGGGAIGLRGFNSGGSSLFDTGAFGATLNGIPVWVSLELTASGTNVNYRMNWEVIGQSIVTVEGAAVAGSIGNAQTITFDPQANLTQTAVGHVTYQSAAQDMAGGEFASQINAWIGETAGTRFQRLCTEQLIPVKMRGQLFDTQPMGPQTATDLISLLQECVDADRGMFWEPPWLGALGYRTLSDLLNQAPALSVPYASGQVTAAVQSSEDDQFTINDAQVVNTYTGGQGEVAVTSGPLSNQPPPNGVGPYQQQPQINLAQDQQVFDEAGWLTWVGTAPDLRYPEIPFHLRRALTPAVFNALQELDLGDRLQIVTPATPPASTAQPLWLPPSSQTPYARGGIDVLINHVDSTLNIEKYDKGIVGVPTTPYLVAQADDTVHGRVDSASSTLDSPLGPTDTLMAVANPIATPQLRWTSAAAAYPFDLAVGGEQVTAVAISGPSASASSDAANPPQIAVTPNTANSLLYASVVNPTNATTFTADANTTFSANVADATNTKCYGTCRTTASPSQGVATTFGASAPAVAGLIAAIEVMAAGGGTITEDPSSPPSVSTLVAKTVTTARFTPPPGSLLLMMTAANGTGGGFVGTSFGVGFNNVSNAIVALAFRQLAIDGLGQCVIFAFRVPSGIEQAITVSATTSGSFSANGLLLTVKVLTAAAAGAGNQVMNVIRSQNGVVKPQVVFQPVSLYTTPVASL